ncbi:MAG: aldo/keto reductase [Acidimicrobiales bacterium]|nr:aldo/keto reductase [Acidimicrobiales bacterium]
MDHRLLGRSGLRVSAVSLGVLNFGARTDAATAERILLDALDAGVNLVDTADVYAAGESERVTGEILRRTGRRDQVVLATKFGLRMGDGPNDVGATRRYIIQACDASLRRLGVDHIDLYQLHRPYFDTAPEETLRALDDLVRSGKVRQIGSSTHPAWYSMECAAVSDRCGLARYVSEQSPYNILDRRIEHETVPFSVRHGVGILVWSPLAAGILVGRYPSAVEMPAGSRGSALPALRRRVTARSLEVVEGLRALALEHDISLGQLALRWVRDRPGVTSAIVGPRTVEQLADLLPAFTAPSLPDDVLARVDSLVAPGETVSDFHNSSGWTPGSARPLSI